MTVIPKKSLGFPQISRKKQKYSYCAWDWPGDTPKNTFSKQRDNNLKVKKSEKWILCGQDLHHIIILNLDKQIRIGLQLLLT